MRFAALLLLVVVCPLAALAAEPVSFRNQVAPLLLEHCASCHGPKKAEGGYRLDSFAQLSRAGDSGIVPLTIEADKQHSELVRRLRTEDASERMPAERDPLVPEVIELIARWQAEGSHYDGEDPNTPLFELVPARNYPAAPDKYRSPIPITALAFTPDGTQVIASGYHELTVWETATGKLVKRVGNLPERILCLDWSPDGKTLAVAGGSPGHIGEVRLVNWESGAVAATFGRAADMVQAVRFQPGGAMIATGNTDGTLRWFNVADLKTGPQRGQSCRHRVRRRLESRWQRLASASRDKTAKVFVIETAELISTYSAHGEPVSAILLQDGDKEVTTFGADRKIHRWQIEDSKTLAKVDLPGSATRTVLDGPNAWFVGTDRAVRQMELASTKLIRDMQGHLAWTTSIAVHPASGKVASGSLDGDLRVWNTADGAAVGHWTAAP